MIAYYRSNADTAASPHCTLPSQCHSAVMMTRVHARATTSAQMDNNPHAAQRCMQDIAVHWRGRHSHVPISVSASTSVGSATSMRIISDRMSLSYARCCSHQRRPHMRTCAYRCLHAQACGDGHGCARGQRRSVTVQQHNSSQ